MKIVLISDLENRGGAARCTTRLADALSRAGHDVLRVVGEVDGRSGQRLYSIAPDRSASVVLRLLRKASSDQARSAFQLMTRSKLQKLLGLLRPDVINVHNMHSASWDVGLIGIAARHAPVAWTLHDLWSMTGRCAYAYDCRKFLDGCDDSCPTPQEYPPLDPARIRGAWNARRSIYARLPRFVVVAPSQWIAREARAGLWKSHRIEVIPYGVPTEVYVPRLPEERRSIRRELGVADEDVFGVVIADNLGERRKGFDLAREALAGGHSGLAVGMIGASDAMPGIAGVKSFHLGYVGDERRMSSICAAADFLLHPAPVDNLPNVVLEAMACGTPTVAFPIGGLPDMVRPGRTGWLAAETSAAGLRRALATATAAVRGASSYRESCRAVAEEEYTEALQARRYAALFSEMLEAAAGDRARSL